MKKGLVDPSPGSNSPRAQQSLGPPVLGPTSINMQIKRIFTRISGSKEQWTLIPMVENYSRTTGPQYQWALGLVGFAKVGRCQDQWTLVLKNPSTLRPKYTWTLGLMDPRTSGPKDQWTLIPMVENYSRTTEPQYQWALGLVGFAKVGRCQDQWTLVLKNRDIA